MNRITTFIGILILCCSLSSIAADEQPLQVKVAEPFLNVHTGPGRGYPVFHVIEKGESLRVLKRHTGWYKVAMVIEGKELNEDGEPLWTEGWISHEALSLTLVGDGQPIKLTNHTFDQFEERDFELGAMIGEMDGSTSFSMYGGWVFSENLAVELSYTQALGDFSENEIFMGNIVNSPFPEWVVSPFFSLGIGKIKTSPRSNLVETGDDSRDDDIASVGGGLNYYLMRNFMVKFEYRNYVALTSRNENEEFDEWKIGFAVFF